MKQLTVTLKVTVDDTVAQDEVVDLVTDILDEGLYLVGNGRNGDSINEHGAGVVWRADIVEVRS